MSIKLEPSFSVGMGLFLFLHFVLLQERGMRSLELKADFGFDVLTSCSHSLYSCITKEDIEHEA